MLLVYPSCSKFKYYASEDADCRVSTKSLFPIACTALSLSAPASLEWLKEAALSAFSYVAFLILHASIAEITGQLLSLSYV